MSSRSKEDAVEGLTVRQGQAARWVPAVGAVLAIGWGVTQLTQGQPPWAFALLVLCAGAALLSRIPVVVATRTSLRTIVTLSLTAFAVVTACTVAATALGALLGLVHLDLVGLSGVAQLEASLPSRGGPLPPPLVVLVVSVVGTVIASFSANALAGIGEEIGWRGYLLPALMPLGRVRALVIMGVVWAFWHAPIVLLGYDFDDAGRVMALLALTVFGILFGTLLGWLRIRGDSVVPASVGHGTFNGWMRLLPFLVAAGQPVGYLTASPMGLVGYAVFGALAGWLLTRCAWVPKLTRAGSATPQHHRASR